MMKTSEEFAQSIRQTIRKFKGSKTKECQLISRSSRVKQSRLDQVVLMPDEDPCAVANLYATWRDHYQPRSPAAEHLVNLCVRAKLMSDRGYQAHESAVAVQLEEAIEAWDQARAAMVGAQEEW